MKKTLYIHIGTGKTGTTALQDFFYQNSVKLLDFGLVYCVTGKVSLDANNHHMLCRNFNRENANGQSTVTENLKKLREEISKSNASKFLISSEYFPGLDLGEVSEIYDIINVEIVPVVYLRRQDEFLESWYAQVVKAFNIKGSIYSLQKRLEKSRIFDYKYLIDTWKNGLSSNNFIVRAYEKESFYGGNIFSDFLNAIGLSVDIGDFHLERKDPNPSIKPNQIRLGIDLSEFCNDEQLKSILSPQNGLVDDSRWFLSSKERSDLIDRYSEKNHFLAREYLGRDALFLNKDTPKADAGDYIQNGFIDNYIYYLYFENKELLAKIEDPLIRFLKIKSGQYKKLGLYNVEHRLIMLAFLIRPNAKHICQLLHDNLVRRNMLLSKASEPMGE